MTHEHANEFRLRILHADQTEELSGWMNCQEKVMQATTRLRGSPVKAYWLQVRTPGCPNCQQQESTVVEFPLNPAASEDPRFPGQTNRRPYTSSRASSAGA